MKKPLHNVKGLLSGEFLASTAGERIAAFLKEKRIRIVVLDDDPTGIQTVHGCLLATGCGEELFSQLLRDRVPLSYILTNTRSMPAARAEQTILDTAGAVLRANREPGFRLIFISRSDSTLRGHFPLEPDAIAAAIRDSGQRVMPPLFFVPALFEAGRVTRNDIQYLREGDSWIPVAETEFARDPFFPYASRDLRGYIAEKSGNRVKPGRIGSVTLPAEGVPWTGEIPGLTAGAGQKEVVIVNASGYGELQRFCEAFLPVFAAGGGISVWRTSSSLPKALGGIPDRALLAGSEMVRDSGPGLIIVGSHVSKSSRQLEKLLTSAGVAGVEAGVREILAAPGSCKERMLHRIGELMDQGITPVVYTSREVVMTEGGAGGLGCGERISAFLTGLVRALPRSPAFLVAKGGITSHELLVRGLGVSLARVAGQAAPGVPVLFTGKEHRFPEMPYVIFPGNVGDEESLLTLFDKLGGGRD